PLSSPPARDLSPAPMLEPRCRERTVSPKHSPIVRVIRAPGTSLDVTMIMERRVPAAGPCPGYSDPMPHPIMFDEDDPVLARVRALALALPGAAEKISHGRPNFFTTKVFATYSGSLRSDGTR